MNNKELIERLRLLIKNGRYYTKEQARIDISDAVNALQDAEAEINRLKAELEDEEETTEMLSTNLVELKAKISEQVDPLQLLEYALQKIPNIAYVGKDWMEDIIQQFKKERDERTKTIDTI